MKRGAVFINIGRGATVKLTDLDAALRSGHLAGAGLDVFEREPLPADHPLWDAPGMLITPMWPLSRLVDPGFQPSPLVPTSPRCYGFGVPGPTLGRGSTPFDFSGAGK